MIRRITLLILPLFLGLLLRGQTAQIGGILNAYAAVISYGQCVNSFIVDDASQFRAGDTVYIMQMKGAVIDSTDNANFGTITNYANAGNYELNYVQQVIGNEIRLRNVVTRTYSIPAGKVQFIRVPFYQSAVVTSPLTCAPWDGNKGGVLAMIVAGTLNLNAVIDVTGKGFRGGVGVNINSLTTNCSNNGYNYPVTSILAAQKGESIVTISNNIISGKGAPAAGGGGGLDHNSGGGGGGNGGTGGFGGYQLEPCTNSAFDNRGIGGRSLSYTVTANKVFLGSGGGAGHGNNPGNIPMSGANGGGLVIITADALTSNSNRIISDGATPLACTVGGNSTDCHDAMGGGGAGGTVLLDINQILDPTIVQTRGGKGGDMVGDAVLGGRIGPGGGGGGGVLWVKGSSIPANLSQDAIGGVGGVITLFGTDPWGTTAGSSGFSAFGLKIVIDTAAFIKNIDSVRIKDSLVNCGRFNFQGHAYLRQLLPITNWNWSFGDGTTLSYQTVSHNHTDTSHTYTTPGSYQVKLIATDINGCKDSNSVSVTVFPIPILRLSSDTTICKNGSAQLMASGANTYLWDPAQSLNDATIPNPVATPLVNTTYFVTAKDLHNCTVKDSIKVSVKQVPIFTVSADNKVCSGKTIQLNATGGDNYLWTPSHSLNDASIANPIASPDTSTSYAVYISEAACHYDTNLSVRITVDPTPIVQAQKSNDIDCSNLTSQLSATGADSYLWTPSTGLSNPTISNPIASLSSTTTYILTGTNSSGCKSSDTLTVNVTNGGKAIFVLPNAFTPNADRHNQCFGIQRWGNVTVQEFSIYNRWGQRVFNTKDPTKCWDGTVNGLPQAAGAYAYVIKASSFCGEIIHKGLVMLIR